MVASYGYQTSKIEQLNYGCQRFKYEFFRERLHLFLKNIFVKNIERG